jgi:hypothetical protein
MQGPSTGTGRLPKKLKLADNECLTNSLSTEGPFKEPATDGSISETFTEPFGEHLSETSTNASAMSEPTIDKLSMNCPDTAKALDSSDMDDLPTFAIHIQIEGDEITSISLIDNTFLMTHGDGFAILNKFFEQPVIRSGPVSDVEGLSKWLAFTAEFTYQDEVLEDTVRSNTPEVLSAPHCSPSTSINAVSPKASDMLDPDLPVASATTSKSGSSRSSQPGSLSTDLTSYTPSETHHTSSNLASVVRHTPYVKRPILDELAQ